MWRQPQGEHCKSGQLQALQRTCAAQRGAGPADRQVLFTVYVHPHPDFAGFAPDSPFHGHEVSNRVQVRGLQISSDLTAVLTDNGDG